MAQPPSPTTTVTNPRIAKLIELETGGRIKPEHQQELDTYRAQGWAPKKSTNNQPTVEQGKAGSFYRRAIGAETVYGKTGEVEGEGAGPRGMARQWLHESFPDLENSWINNPDRQMADQAQRNFIAATLRYESGANIPTDEFDNQYRIFFPMPGDGADVIAQKKEARREAIEGLRFSTGPVGDLADKAAANAADEPRPTAKQQKKPTNWNINPGGDGGDIGFASKEHAEANSLPEGAQQFQQDLSFAISRGDLKTPEDIMRFGQESKLNGGRGFTINPEEAKAVIDSVQKGGGFNVNTPQFQAPDISADRGEGGPIEMGKAFLRGVPAAVGLDDELNAIGDTFQGGTLRENLSRERAIRDYDEENNFGPRIAGSLATGFLFPSGAANAARTAGIGALRSNMGMQAARGAARGAYASRLGMEGAGLGALYGAGASDGSAADRLTGGVIGAAAGGAAGYGLGRLGQLFTLGQRRPPPGGGNAVVEAAARREVPIVAADANPGLRGVTSFLEAVPGSSGLIRNRMQSGADNIENQIADLGGGIVAPDRTGVGEAVQGGAQNWVRRSSDIGGRLYDRAEQLSGGAQINATTALQQLDNQIGDLSRMGETNAPKLRVLNAIRADLVDQNGAPRMLGIGDIRALRTNARELIDSSQVRSGDLDRRLGMVVDAANADIMAGLQGNNRALAAYRRADDFWRDRANRIDTALSKVIGKADAPISGEQVMAKIESLAAPRTGNAQQLRTILGSLRPDERQQVAANIAGSLGRSAPDAEFSVPVFFSQVGKLSPRARNAIFGRDGAEALEDLATIAEGRRGTLARLNNSGSGRVSNYFETFKGLLGIGGGAGLGAAVGIGATSGAAATAVGLGGAYATSRLITNPAFARWAANGLRQNTVGGIRSSINSLGRIATSQPGIRQEVLALQSKLMQYANDNFAAGRSVASDEQRQQQ